MSFSVAPTSLVTAADDLSAFGQDPWWLVLIKAVLIFLLLVLLTLSTSGSSAVWSPGCSTARARTCTDRSVCCRASPTA
jgi:hypothetical protein